MALFISLPVEKNVLNYLIPCQKPYLKPILVDYIYRIIQKKSKEKTPQKGFALIEKRYPKYFRPLIFVE